MTNEFFRKVSERAEILRRQREQVRNSPVILSVREMLARINQDALSGKDRNSLNGESFDDLSFSLEWEGEHTKLKKRKFTNLQLEFGVAPFYLIIEPVRLEGEDLLRFRITANYSGEEEDTTEIGITERLDPELLRPILEAQIDAIRESAQK